MLEETNPSRDGFHKYRRNLLIISWALFAGLWIGLNVDNLATIRVFGNTVSVQNPSRIAYIIWLMWAYFLLRYIACHIELTKSHQKDFFRYVLQQEVKLRYEYILKKIIRREYQDVKWHEARVGQLILSRKLSYQCQVSIRPGSNSEDKFDIQLSVFTVWLARLKAFFYTIFGRTITSEYYYPYAISFAPVVLLAYEIF